MKIAMMLAVSLVCCVLSFADNPAVTVNVDAAAGHHPISPWIYGVAFANTDQLLDLNCPLNRSGGNNTSRYNWQLNADNRGFDWYFESLPYSSSTPGEVGDTFISQSRSGLAEPMLTIPMIDWIAKLGSGRTRLCSFSIAKYGAQTGNDWQWYADAGNGILSPSGDYVINDPTDANTPNSVPLQQGWVQHLVSTWGTSDNGGLRFYLLDNEHSIWFSTHRDAAPVGATMEQIRDKMVAFAGMIKTEDPAALVLGPEEWGWGGYLYSGYDQQYGSLHGWDYLPDYEAHGQMLYLPWMLDQIHQQSTSSGKRLLDVFTLHFYPQGGEFSDDTSLATQQLRNRSTRTFWDPNYTNESWINDQVYLIPRMQEWVATWYPGTKTGITEYNWGAESHINGATAQADILGIFGREGLDYATRWTTPDASTPTYKAIKMYRNYDGGRSTFGDTSVSTAVPDPDTVAAFGALRSGDNALTIMLISKYLNGNTPVTVNLGNFQPDGVAHRWQLTASNAINQLSDVTLSGSQLNLVLPEQSITMVVIPSGTLPPQDLLFDDFEDGVQAWLVAKPAWLETGGELQGTGSRTAIAFAPVPWSPSGQSSCSTCTAELSFSVTGGEQSKLFVQPWYQDKNNRVDIIVKEDTDTVILRQVVGGMIRAKQKAKIAIDPGSTYQLRSSFNGSDFSLSLDGTLLLVLPAYAEPAGNLALKVKNTTASFQQVRIY